MKKTSSVARILALALLLIPSTGIASAQFKCGIKVGMNVEKMHFSKETFKPDNGCGFTGGFMAEFIVPAIGVGLDGSIMYTHLNSKSLNLPDLPDADVKTGRNFIEIPINIKYKLTLPAVAAIIKPYVFTGPDFAFKLDKNPKRTIENIATQTCQIAWNFGLGVELFRHVQVGASYGLGINNIAKLSKVNEYLPNVKDLNIKNNYWTITAAYLF